MYKIENEDIVKFLKEYAKKIGSKLQLYGIGEEYTGDGTEDNIDEKILFMQTENNRIIDIRFAKDVFRKDSQEDQFIFSFRFYNKPLFTRKEPDVTDPDLKSIPAYVMDRDGNFDLYKKLSNEFNSEINSKSTFQEELIYFFENVDEYFKENFTS